MNATTDLPQLLTCDELACALRIDLRTLRRRRHDPAFPQPVQLGRSLRWRQADVRAWLGGEA